MSSILWLLAGGILGAGVGAYGVHRRRKDHEARRDQAMRAEQAEQAEQRLRVEDRLRRTLVMFQLLQDVTAAAGVARSLPEALQQSLDIVCSYTGWPVGHMLLLSEEGDTGPRLRPSNLWHLENPHDFEAFLRSSERKPLRMGRSLPGQAWTSRRVQWASFASDPDASPFYQRALDVGLTHGFSVPVHNEDAFLGVMEFFSPPVPDPDETVLKALMGVGEQLGRVAERLLAQAKVEALNQRLVELDEEKSQFLAIASHDLKNPLNAMGLMADMLAQETLEPAEVANLGIRIADEARRASKLIQKLLDVSAIESGRFNLHPVEINLGELLLQIRANYADRASSKGQELVLDWNQEDALVRADREYLWQVLDNLVSNAIKFTLPGPPLRSIRLGLRIQGDDAVVEVQDAGPGFTMEDQAKAFGRFAKLSARPTGGESSSGLGLSIVKRLVEAMGGRITLSSQPGQGALFRVILPLA